MTASFCVLLTILYAGMREGFILFAVKFIWEDENLQVHNYSPHLEMDIVLIVTSDDLRWREYKEKR